MPVHPTDDTRSQKGGQWRTCQVQLSIPKTQSAVCHLH